MTDGSDRDGIRKSRRAAIVWEFCDFVPLAAGGLYVQVNHHRTVYEADGRIRKETAALECLLEPMIRAFHGKVDRSAGMLNALFDDSELAKACAQAITTYHRKKPELSGRRLSIPL